MSLQSFMVSTACRVLFALFVFGWSAQPRVFASGNENPDALTKKILTVSMGLNEYLPFYSQLSRELVNDSAFTMLLNAKTTDGAEKYVRAILLVEVRKALQNSSYPAEDFKALYPFIQKEISENPKAPKELHRARETLVPKYRKILSADLEALVTASDQGVPDLLDHQILFKEIEKRSFEEQMKLMSEALKKRPHNPHVRKIFSGWSDGFVFEVTKNPEKFLKFYTSFVNDPLLRGEGEVAVKGLERLYQEREKLLKASKIKKFQSWVEGQSLSKINRILSQVEKSGEHLPAKERLYFHYALHETENRSKVYKFFYSNGFDTPGFNIDDAVFFLKPAELDLKPNTQHELSKLWREMIINDGYRRPIGPTIFAKLLDEDPKLAKALAHQFFNFEFFPSFLGDTSLVRRSSMLEHENEFTSVKQSQDRILRYLKRQGSPEQIKRFQELATQASLGTQANYHFRSKFERILPFIDTETLDGSRFVFQNGPIERISTDPEYRNAAKRYLSYLATDPQELLREMRQKDRFFFYFIQKPGLLNEIFHDDPKALSSFAKAYLASSPDVYESVKKLNLPQRDAAQAYQNVLKDYIQHGNPTEQEMKAARTQFKNFLVILGSPSYQDTPYARDIKRIGTEFEQWYFDPQKAFPNCDVSAFLKSMIRN